MEYENILVESSTSNSGHQFWEYFDNALSNDTFTSESTSIALEDVYEIENRDQRPILATYGVLFIIGALGNLAVLVALAKSRRRRSRVDMMMTHLAIADVSVTCGVIPLEIGWKYTNAWLAGMWACKVLLVLRAFGLYLSSNVLVCISIDRFFAVLYPLRLGAARRRAVRMLYAAWAAALACSLPQSFVFRVMRHPRVADFEQCVSFGAFPNARLEVAYNVFCMCAMYFIPLLFITGCYVAIFCKIRQNSNEIKDNNCSCTNSTRSVKLRRTALGALERARRRTLRMTVAIVSVFALCWLPYATMAMWYMVDRLSASKVSPRIQDLLFAMAVSNSCMNPIVYGSYALDLHRLLRRALRTSCCGSTKSSNTVEKSGSSSSKNRKQNLETPLIVTQGVTKPRLGVRFAETTMSVPAEVTRDVPRKPRVPRAPA